MNNTDETDQLDVESQRFQFEKEKAERELKLELRRYALERYKTRLDQRLLNKNFGVIVSGTIALAAVLVSLGQVWVAKISKDKELQIASFQKQAENERLDKQKEHELSVQSVERERQWNLDRAKFIIENKRTLFAGSPEELRRMSLIIETVFPHDIAAIMFENLRNTAASSEAQRVWSNAQQRIQQHPAVIPSGRSSPASVVLPSPTPIKTSCACPPPVGGGVTCFGFDNIAICRIVDDKCVARCVQAH